MTGRHLITLTGPRRHRSGHAARTLLRAGIVLALLATRASAGHLKVDDDRAQCPTAAYTRIQAAVNAAAPGDTIVVCPGHYAEQVTITKSVKIKGKAPKVKTCNTLATPDPTIHTVIDAPPVTGVGGIGFDVFADNVAIQNLVIMNAGETGIRTDPAYGAFTLKNSVLYQDANGIYFHSRPTTRSTVKSNCFYNSGEAGVRTRYGLVDASITRNLFFNTVDAAAIIVDHEPATTTERVTISRNLSNQDSTFAVLVGTKDTLVSKNTVDTTVGTAIFVGGDNVGLTIAGNKVTNAGTRGIRFNTAAFGGGPSTGVLVSKNTVDKAGIHGISVDSSAGESTLVSSTIEKNTVSNSGQTGTGDGIRVEDPTASGANGGNTIQNNAISGSFNHDCHDATVGTGTAGTANTWSHDSASTQNVANLCFSGGANGVAETTSTSTSTTSTTSSTIPSGSPSSAFVAPVQDMLD